MSRFTVAIAVGILLQFCSRSREDRPANKGDGRTRSANGHTTAFLQPSIGGGLQPCQNLKARSGAFSVAACWTSAPAYAAELPGLPPLDHIDPDSFGLGILAGVFGTLSTLVAVALMFFRNLRGGDLDGSKLAATGGLVMPSFFFQRAEDIFSNVKEDAARSTERFRETGRFEEIYGGIERSQEAALLRSVDALEERFPKSGIRQVVFGVIRFFALSSTRVAATLYDFALRVQSAAGNAGARSGPVDILNELWMLDEARCTVSSRRPGKGGRRPWVDKDADILVDQQVAALRRTVADIAQRPLFARVAPQILARPTYLSLVRLFDVFQPADSCSISGSDCQEYTAEEANSIDDFLETVTRTNVMRRAFRHVAAIAPFDIKSSWTEVLRRIWFQRSGGSPCVFEHVFLGNQTEDSSGQPIAGGLHCWLKFYLEEARGTAKYLGYVYNCPESGLRDSRFVSGKFVWDHAGFRLVKEQGGFFVGTSPEWQLACGTVAYFETMTPALAETHGWEPWLGARTVGYTKDLIHDGFRYRHFVCCSENQLVGSRIEGIEHLPTLCTTYTSFLGAAAETPDDFADTAELDNICSNAELVSRLPNWLVTEGIALREESELCRHCATFCLERGCKSLREALDEVRHVFEFELEDAVAAAADGGFPRIRALVEDTEEVARIVLDAVEASVPLSVALPDILEKLRAQGRRGPRIHQPLRLLLTGRAEGAPVSDIFRLLELAEKEGGEEAGVRLRDRLSLVRELFPVSGTSQLVVGSEAPTTQQRESPASSGYAKLQMVS